MATRNIGATLSLNSTEFIQGAQSAVTATNNVKTAITGANSIVRDFGNNSNLGKWKAELAGVQTELNQNKIALGAIQAEQEKVNSAFYKARSEVNSIKLEQDKLSQALKDGKINTEAHAEKQKVLNRKLEKAKEVLNQTKNVQQEVKIKIDSAKAAVSESVYKQETLNEKLKQGEAAIRQEKNAQADLNDEIDVGAKKQKNSNNNSNDKSGIQGAASVLAGSELSSMGATAGRFALNVATGAINAANQFETSMAKVGTIADTKVISLNDLSQGIKNMSTETGKSATELAEAMYQSISAGVDTGSVLNFLNTANKAAIGGYTDTATAVDGLSSVLNTYGMKSSAAEVLANQFLITQNKGKTTFGELAGSIGQVAPVANSAGVGIDELLSSVAALTANGLGTSEAMTGVKSALSNVIKPTSEASTLAQQLGLDFSVGALQAKGFSGFLQDVKDKTGGNIETMGKLFGSVEGLNSVLTLTSDNGMKLMNDTMSDMSTNTTALDNAFGTMQESSGAKLEKLNQSFENLKISIGDNLTEPLSSLADLAAGALGHLEPLAPVIVGVVAAIGSIGALTSIAGVITTISGVMTALGVSSMSALAPFLAIPLIIAAVAAGVVLVVQNWDLIKEKAGQCWEAIKGFFGGIGEWFTDKWNDIKDGAMNLWNGVTEKWNGVKETAYNIWNGVKENCGQVIDGIKTYISPKLDNIKKAYEDHGGGLQGIAAGAMEGIKQYYSIGFDALNNMTGGKLGEIATNLQPGFETIKNIGVNGFNSMMTAYKESGGGIKGVFSGIMAGAQSVWNSGFSLLNNITGGKAGEILSTAQAKFNSIKDTIEKAITGAKDTVFGIFDTIKQKISDVWENIKGVIKAPRIVQEGTISLAGIDTPIPKLGISWNAAGGIFNRPTVLPTLSGYQGFGEAGTEAILPLDTFWNNLRRFINESKNNQTNNSKINNHNEINIYVNADGKSGDEVIGEIINPLKISLSNM